MFGIDIKKVVSLNILMMFLVVCSGQRMEYGVGIGAAVYWGDLNSPEIATNLAATNLAVQANLKYNFSNTLDLRGNLLYGSLSGDDGKSSADWQLLRNLSFDSKLIELSILGDLHILNFFMEPGKISPYLTAGIGAFYFNPTTIYQGDKIELQPLGTEGQGMDGFAERYKKVELAIPFGGGIQLMLNETMNLNVDLIARKTFTDYIDDVSTDYVTYDVLASGNGPLAAQLGNRQGEFLGQAEPVILPTGAKRGGADVTDYYITMMVTLSFKINSSGYGRRGIQCPKF